MRLRIILRNILSNWLGYCATMAIGFVLSPFVVHRLGTTGYGVWTLVISVTGYFGMLDLGIRSSVGRFVARHIAHNDELSTNRTISSAVAILTLGSIAALAATLVASLFFGAFKIDGQFESAARIALAIAGVNISVALPMGVFTAILISVERFDVITTVSVISALTRAGLYVVVLRNGYGLVALALITLVVSIGEYSSLAVAASRLYRPLKLRRRLVDFATCGELLNFGIYRFIWIVANQLIFYTDSVVIGIVLNAGAITYFAIAGSLITYGRNVTSLATDTFFPSATRLDSQNDMVGLRALQIFGTKVALLIALPLCMGFIILGRQFISLWMGKEYVISAVYLSILAIVLLTNAAQNMSSLILAGMAKHRVLAYIALAEGTANLVLSVVLARHLGLVGVAWGTVIPAIVSTLFVIPYALRKVNLSVREYLSRACARPVLCAVPASAMCYAATTAVAETSWSLFAVEVVGMCGLYFLVCYFVCLTSEQRESVRIRVRNIRREPITNEA